MPEDGAPAPRTTNTLALRLGLVFLVLAVVLSFGGVLLIPRLEAWAIVGGGDQPTIENLPEISRFLFITLGSVAIAFIIAAVFDTDITTNGEVPFLGGKVIFRAGGAVVMLAFFLFAGFRAVPPFSQAEDVVTLDAIGGRLEEVLDDARENDTAPTDDEDALTLDAIRSELRDVLARDRAVMRYEEMLGDGTMPMRINSQVWTVANPALGIADLQGQRRIVEGRWVRPRELGVVAEGDIDEIENVNLPPAVNIDPSDVHKVYYFDRATIAQARNSGVPLRGQNALLMAYVVFESVPEDGEASLSVELYMNTNQLPFFLRQPSDAAIAPETEQARTVNNLSARE